MNRRSEPTWQQSFYGLAFWLALAALMGLLFFGAYLPSRNERREQLARKALLEQEVRETMEAVRLRELRNQAIEKSDETVLRDILQGHGYVGEGRGIVILPEQPAASVDPDGR